MDQRLIDRIAPARIGAGARRVLAAPLCWYAAVFAVGALVLLRAALQLMARLPATGDEPWYLLQALALVRFHTPDLARVVHDHALYAHLLGAQRDDHTRDYLGNGERMLVNLPGYAALIAPAYALGGRPLVGVFQALVAAGTGVLVFAAAWHALGSRLVALVAWLAYLVSLPVLVYAGQIFPSTLATGGMMLGFVLVAVQLPRAQGWRLLATGLGVGLMVAVLPWIHIKYTLTALALAASAAWVLWPRLRLPLRPPPARFASRHVSGSASVVAGRPADARWARAALGSVGVPLVLSLALIATYSRHYFGAWTPPNSLAQPDWLHPQFGTMFALYADMFFGRESGLLPWVPLALLVVPGALVLLRRAPRQGCVLVALLVGQLGAFVTSAISPVFQGKALPARFTMECAPLFALCVAAVFALGAPALRAWWMAAHRWLAARGAWPAHVGQGSETAGSDTPAAPPAAHGAADFRLNAHGVRSRARVCALVSLWFGIHPNHISNASSAPTDAAPHGPTRRETVARAALALGTLALLGVTAWFAAVGQRDPALLYPGPAGPRVVAEYPQALPAAWFALFPTVLPAQWVTHGVLALSPATPDAVLDHDARGAPLVLGMPGHVPAGARLAATSPLLAPAGAYTATLLYACAPTADVSTVAQLSVLSPWNHAHPVVAARSIGASGCQGIAHPLTTTLRFSNDGYRPLTLAVVFAGTTGVAVWSVAYEPALDAAASRSLVAASVADGVACAPPVRWASVMTTTPATITAAASSVRPETASPSNAQPRKTAMIGLTKA